MWALGLAVAASRTRNPVLLILILVVAGFVVAARRSDAPWANSYIAFLKLGLVVIGVRVVLQALLSTRSQGNYVLFTLPQIPLPEWANGVKLGGEVTAEAVLTALYDGLQLAVMLCCIGAANALASPRRLLKSLPGALYEMGVACVVALTFAPQLVTDARRIRAARRLRGRTRGSFRTTAMPVLEGALDRSVELAAAMDSRGYGRTAHVPRRQRRITGGSVLLGLLGIALGVYSLLTDAMAFPVAAGALAVGLLLAVGAMAVGHQRVDQIPLPAGPVGLARVAGHCLWCCGCRSHDPGRSSRCGRARPSRAADDPARALAAGARPADRAGSRRRGTAADPTTRVGAGMIEFDHVTVTYDGATTPALRDVSFTIPEGELALVIGRTGSGKSTLLRTINGLVPHFTGGTLAGRVRVNGRDTKDYRPRDLADVVGIVGQDPMAGFVTDTVEDELAYSMESLGVPRRRDAPPGRGDARPAGAGRRTGSGVDLPVWWPAATNGYRRRTHLTPGGTGSGRADVGPGSAGG